MHDYNPNYLHKMGKLEIRPWIYQWRTKNATLMRSSAFIDAANFIAYSNGLKPAPMQEIHYANEMSDHYLILSGIWNIKVTVTFFPNIVVKLIYFSDIPLRVISFI